MIKITFEIRKRYTLREVANNNIHCEEHERLYLTSSYHYANIYLVLKENEYSNGFLDDFNNWLDDGKNYTELIKYLGKDCFIENTKIEQNYKTINDKKIKKFSIAKWAKGNFVIHYIK